MNELSPAYLWIGARAIVDEHVCDFVCQQLCCQRRACRVCRECRQVVEHRHPSLCWLEPDGAYTLEQLEIVKRTASFARSEAEGPYLFVISRADLLTHACANSLLKHVEEPPPGYHFIFTSMHEHAVLPTLRSRCLINQVWNGKDQENQHPLYTLFVSMQRIDAVQFLSFLEPCPDEYETARILDELIHFWMTRQLASPASFAVNMIDLCAEFLTKTGAPGSSKMLWRAFMTRHQMLVEQIDGKKVAPCCPM